MSMINFVTIIFYFSLGYTTWAMLNYFYISFKKNKDVSIERKRAFYHCFIGVAVTTIFAWIKYWPQFHGHLKFLFGIQ